jgi:hypothetical protein
MKDLRKEKKKEDENGGQKHITKHVSLAWLSLLLINN